MRNKNRCAPEPLSQSLMEMSKLVDELDNNLAIDDNNPILVENGNVDVGVITRSDLLRTVIEGTEMS